MRPISSFEPATTPATTSLWPPRYLEAEWTTMSTPSDSGRWKTGVAQLLSMMVGMPRDLASAASAPTSWVVHDPAGRAFHVEQLGAGQGACHRLLVAPVDIGHLDAHALEQRPEQPERVGVDVPDCDDAVARLDEGQHGGRDRRHAAGKTDRVLGALQFGQHLLEHAHGRVQPARIGRAHLFAAIGLPASRHSSGR